MKNLQTFGEFLNESAKFKGREILPDWLSTRDFGKEVKSTKELKPGKEYILWEPGMDTWQGEYVYQGHTGGKHIFNSNTQFGEGDPMEFTDAEMDEYVTSGDVYEQK